MAKTKLVTGARVDVNDYEGGIPDDGLPELANASSPIIMEMKRDSERGGCRIREAEKKQGRTLTTNLRSTINNVT